MNSTEIISELRKIATYSTSKKEVCTQAADLIEEYQVGISRAIEDMKLIVDTVREKHGDDSCCFACKYDADFSIGESGDYMNECPGFDCDNCFLWRGMKEEV